jgi:hypothetical protein
MDSTPSLPAKPSYRDRFNKLLAEWGSLVLWVYFGIFFVVLVGFALAIKFGFGVEGAAGAVGTWGAAYLATKLTQPVRIAATLVLTPALAALLKRFRKRPDAPGTAELPGSAAPLDAVPPSQPLLDKPAPDSR